MEKIGYFRFILLLSCLVFFIGCSGNQDRASTLKNNANSNSINQKKENSSKFIKPQEINTKEMKIENRDGILFVVDETKEYILTSHGLDYSSHLSSDKNFLVIDVLKMNNLQTIEIFSKKNSSKFKRIKKRFKKEIWNVFFKDKSYSFKDIEKPQIKFYEWVDNDSFELELSYEFRDKFYENIIRYNIYL